MGKKIARIIGRVLLVVLVTIVMLVGTLFIMIKRICSDSAPAARNLFISTVLESGQMKFLASWFCTDAQINEVINANKMESMDPELGTGKIKMLITKPYIIQHIKMEMKKDGLLHQYNIKLIHIFV